MPYITAGVIAASAIYGAVEANNRKKEAKEGIDKLKSMQPKYRTAKDIQTEAELTIKEGYSPEEVANFNQRLARTSNAGYQRAVQMNPNLAYATQAGINYANIGAQSEFSARDAALRRQRVSEYAGRLTGQSNAQTQADIISKREQEIAYGNAKSQANADLYNSLMQLGYAGASAASVPRTSPTGGATSGVPMNPNQPPSASAPPPATPNYGSDAWGRSLYNAPAYPPPPYFGTAQFGNYGQPTRLGANQIPSRQANPALFDPYLRNYY